MLTRERLATALVTEMGAAFGRRFGDRVHLNPAEHWGDASCVATVSIGGRARGAVSVWLDHGALSTLLATEPGTPVESQVLVDGAAALVQDAVAALQEQSGFATLAFGPVTVSLTQTGERAPLLAVVVTMASGGRCPIAVGADLDVLSDPEDERLEAVLDFDLPLVVRFGRAVMPLKALAALGPGAMIDLGRSPDQPVELVMGDKVVALGEVVVVAGNYGVRVTELTGAKVPGRAAAGGRG
jgi:flagellar motor switch protein FliN/FliY